MTIESENCTTRLILIEPIANKASFNITKGMYSDEHLLHELTPNSHIGTVLNHINLPAGRGKSLFSFRLFSEPKLLERQIFGKPVEIKRREIHSG